MEATNDERVLVLRSPKVSSACHRCRRHFGPKSLPQARLDIAGKLDCMSSNAGMRHSQSFHVFHAHCLVDWDSKCCETMENNQFPLSNGRLRIGIDVGGVIVPGATAGNGKEDTLLSDAGHLKQKPMHGSLEVCKWLVETLGPDNVFVVSKAGRKVESNTLNWMQKTGFFDATLIRRQNVHFVRERCDKASLCAKLGINSFVDDNLGVLKHFNCQSNYLFALITSRLKIAMPSFIIQIFTCAQVGKR